LNYDCVIIGGGIVGLATGLALSRRQPGIRLLILEKEKDIAAHQTGRNSGVIHSGIYYKPGSFKAKFAVAGSRSMVEFCQEHGIKHDICGKLIVACEQRELPLLENLYQRGLQNGLTVTPLSAAEVKNIEPHVNCLAGLKVPSTGIVNYRQVCQKYLDLIQSAGGTLQLGVRVLGTHTTNGSQVIETTQGDIETSFIINCAGLHSDRVARSSSVNPGAKIVPFRGEYYELVPERRHLVNTLIYPVPNPDFPFLGVHFTKMIDGSVHAGPNAVLAFKREGYHRTDFNLPDTFETLTYSGFWKMAKKNWSEGLMEMRRSFSKSLFVKSLQRLIPEVQDSDLVPSEAGVRAQALLPDGKLVDDFLIIKERQQVHVCNAPSPAATGSLEIGNYIANEIPELVTKTNLAASQNKQVSTEVVSAIAK
jgi:L-2-hydroxyglutarate oxidase